MRTTRPAMPALQTNFRVTGLLIACAMWRECWTDGEIARKNHERKK